MDAFLADPKTLYGDPPEFGPTNFHRNSFAEWQANWALADSIGSTDDGQIRFVARPYGLFSISVIFKSLNVARLDFEDPNVCEANPHWARGLGVAPRVCGPHFHRWTLNRQHVLVLGAGICELPAREALSPQIRRFEQAFAWLAEQVNVTLLPEQRLFELPVTLV
ncbi:hypothetical protein ABEV34_11965 [Methylorubrum rhodesianum]|uniref:hypothetical protein n=1 Tax=Methylorubrum rhodesianum TaxID=29427 RepID=UPI003D2DBDC9